MFNLFTALFFTIGFIASAFYLSTFFYSLSERLRADRARKQAHDKRVVTLLEAIDQKLNTKP